MKILTLVLLSITLFTSNNFYDLTYKDIEGNEVSMDSYRGKYILIVNVASECGFTPQYEELENLYKTHKDKLVIIGFPCNQFGGQEPGTESEIMSFCKRNYGVTFPLASKIEVKGKDIHSVYSWLTSKELNGVEDVKVNWNFHKFLISPNGKYLGSFGSSVKPNSEKITESLK